VIFGEGVVGVGEQGAQGAQGAHEFCGGGVGWEEGVRAGGGGVTCGGGGVHGESPRLGFWG
jgi:hypothetical protein